MQNSNTLLNLFFKQIRQIENQLDGLEDNAYDIANQYKGCSFPEQEQLAVCLENMLMRITHELSSEIGLWRSSIADLSELILFRKKYGELTDTELEELLDKTPSPELKKQLLAKYGSAESVLKRMAELKDDWRKAFHNTGYAKLKVRLGINN